MERHKHEAQVLGPPTPMMMERPEGRRWSDQGCSEGVPVRVRVRS
jgi:hypothetical protein